MNGGSSLGNRIKSCGEKVIREADLLFSLAREDILSGCKEEALGSIWLYVRPAFTVLVYFVVFQLFFGMSAESSGAPYAVWFLAGMLPWLYFAETVSRGTGVFCEYSFLVKKILFPIRLIPLLKVISGFMLHLIFLIFFAVICVFCNCFRKISLGSLAYAALCLLFYTEAVVRLTSVLRPFFRDVAEMMGLYLQSGVWLSPILWDFQKVPERFRGFFIWNPMFYIVEGFRRAVSCGSAGKLYCFSGIVFWIHCILLSMLGEWLFRRLSGHLADVL